MLKKIFYYWLPAILWMIVIFSLSSKQKVSVSPDTLTNFILLKTLHMIEYAGLFFWLFRATTSILTKNHLSEKLSLALFITIIYAISDEIHQTYVPFREGIIRDVAIDSIGAYIMYIYIKNHYQLIKRFLWKNS